MTERCVAGTRAAVRENIVTPTGVGGGGLLFCCVQVSNVKGTDGQKGG